MWDQIVALEHESHGVISVRVPISVPVLLRGAAVYYEIAAVVPVKTADDIQHGGLAGSALPEDRNKLVLAEAEAYAVQRPLSQLAGFVHLCDVIQL